MAIQHATHARTRMKAVKAFACAMAAMVLPMTFSAAAFASEGGHEASFMSEWGWRIINFSILVFLIAYFGGGYIRKFFADRTRKIEESIKNSESAVEEARAALTEIEDRIKNREAEVAAIMKASRETGEGEKARLVAEGQKAADELLKQAESRIALEVKKAKDAIRAEASVLAVQMAEDLVRKHINESDHKQAVNSYLASVEAGK